jgi:uncharacterized protein with PIN domain
MHYLDTSVLVAAVTFEPSNAHVLQWMRNHDDSLAISNWTQTEMSAALFWPCRAGFIGAFPAG